ncbi:MAG TPA: potassium-transporting ATPase subunit KdpC [Symbiobacteriaceae bacterium]|nr:potassium-transporting ATPase subunit KdpC [Symbiobacteriaceae bacterium]
MIGRAVRFSFVFLILCGLIYPLATTGLARALFPRQSAGTLIAQDGRVVGSELIGQTFSQPGFFHGRVAGDQNEGPSDPKLLERVKADVAKWQQENPGQPVPPDVLTNSGSGVDPHIAPASALAQVARISKVTGIPEAQLRTLVDQATEGRTFGLFGEPRVNVLKLNLALLQLHK